MPPVASAAAECWNLSKYERYMISRICACMVVYLFYLFVCPVVIELNGYHLRGFDSKISRVWATGSEPQVSDWYHPQSEK